FVQIFDVALGNWMTAMTGKPSAGLCVFNETCGSALAIEHNGDVYSCDHYVYPKYKLGNVMETPLGAMRQSDFQVKFGLDKRDTLPKFCRECEVRHACHGECPKHRFVKTPNGEDGLNYLCPAYKTFFNHINPHMQTMVHLLERQQPPAAIRDLIAEQEKAGGGPLSKRFAAAKSGKKRRKGKK
ncbi:MAG: SPASM domain-containing protein, partial [Planctomycetota bacterium]